MDSFKNEKRSPLAIAVLTLGIASLLPLLSFYIVVPNLLLSVVGLFHIKRYRLRGEEMIWTGVILTILGLLIALFIVRLGGAITD